MKIKHDFFCCRLVRNIHLNKGFCVGRWPVGKLKAPELLLSSWHGPGCGRHT